MKTQGMETAYIGIGSNLGDRQANCLKAFKLIDRIPGCTIHKKSALYRTEPVGVEGHEWYVNAVLSLHAGIPARHLLEKLLEIESDMGRVRKEKWDPRPIDLDILLFGGAVIAEKGLIVPHPLMHTRRFVLVPLVQIEPDLRHPQSGRTMKELLDRLPVSGQRVVEIEG